MRDSAFRDIFISTLASKSAAALVVYPDSSSRDQSLRIWFSFCKVQRHRNVVLLHPFKEGHSRNTENSGTQIHESKFAIKALSGVPAEFRANPTLFVGCHSLRSYVPFEQIPSSVSPPLHGDSASSALRMQCPSNVRCGS